MWHSSTLFSAGLVLFRVSDSQSWNGGAPPVRLETNQGCGVVTVVTTDTAGRTTQSAAFCWPRASFLSPSSTFWLHQEPIPIGPRVSAGTSPALSGPPVVIESLALSFSLFSALSFVVVL